MGIPQLDFNILYGCMLYPLAAVWCYHLIMMMVNGEIDMIEGVVGLGLTLFLAANVFVPMFPYGRHVSGFLLITAGITVPILKNYFNTRAHAKIDADILEKACLALEFDHQNWGAHIEIANQSYRLGLLEPAVAHLEAAVTMAPLYTTAEKNRLKLWKDEMDQIKPARALACPTCGHQNALTMVRCAQCNSMILPNLVSGRWVSENMTAKVARVWGIVVIASAISLLALDRLSGTAALPIIFATMFASILFLARVLRHR